MSSAYNLCGMSLIFHRIWTCSRSLLTYIMRWRVLFTKIPGLVLSEINSSHKTSLGAPHGARSHGLGVGYMSEMTGAEETGAIGMVVGGKKEKSRNIHRETLRWRETQKKRRCEGKHPLHSPLVGWRVIRRSRMYVWCVTAIHTQLSKKPNLRI